MTTPSKTQRKKNKKAARLVPVRDVTRVDATRVDVVESKEKKSIASIFPCRNFGMMYSVAKSMDRRGELRFNVPDTVDLLNDQLAQLVMTHYEKQLSNCYDKFTCDTSQDGHFVSEIERTDAMYTMFMPDVSAWKPEDLGITKLPMDGTSYCKMGDEREVCMAYYLFYLPNRHLNQLGKTSIAQAIRDGCSDQFSWCIPGRKALEAIYHTCRLILKPEEYKSLTFTDLGAGKGYWAYWLQNWPKLQAKAPYANKEWKEMKVRVNAVDPGKECKENPYFFHPVIKMSADDYCKSGKADGTVLFICWPRSDDKDIFIEAIKHTKTQLIFMITYPGEFESHDDEGGYSDMMQDTMHAMGWEAFYYSGRDRDYYNPAKDMLSWPSIGNHTMVWTKKGTRARMDKEKQARYNTRYNKVSTLSLTP